MSYQVLARKWRPRSFRTMVGQEHVLKALINALDSQRLHHAYLFTGTRGVGKTTIARIMAKCLNCEQGIGSSPCGECATCKEIDEGRYIDLIEVDAASKTKVEDTRELLDNVQYMPSRGRYKVYLIDEVHMLSTSSFNALLKTLEEPPPHVKFLLATTDPQKLPPTVLSRCLQFSLKNMPPEAIVGHLTQVLTSENIPHEEAALWLLGRAADGSMRDAMSLTDQAVAFGEGKVLAEDVRAMLGTLDQGQVFSLLAALANADAGEVLAVIASLAEQGPDWQSVLAEMLTVLHRTSVAQMLPDAVDNSQGDREQVLQLAQAFSAEDVQFYYQVALHGRRDLPLAPDPRDGFEMVMLRMLAFRPASLPGAPRNGLKLPAAAPQAETAATPVAEASEPEPEPVVAAPVVTNPVAAEPETEATAAAEPEQDATSEIDAAAPQAEAAPEIEAPVAVAAEPEVAAVSAASPEPEPEADSDEDELEPAENYIDYEYLSQLEDIQQQESSVDLRLHIPPASGAALRWIELCARLDLGGIAGSIARSCALLDDSSNCWQLQLDRSQSALFNPQQKQRINDAVNLVLDAPVELEIEVAELSTESPALNLIRRRAQQHLHAEQSLEQDEILQLIKQQLGATVCQDTITPLNPL